ncbi:tRNA nuclease CdiA-2 [Pandoraea fibrosis]|uniref:tRNA nuclease CdiA-2 n=2 Tax=Pandoraea fibrosis TaxID=1891094 RepID=A0A5E4Z3N2_9BURK|nr:tRNA nuclease CdiA-2 [Pandoraea fibrosis]
MGASASVVLNNLLDKAGEKSGKDLSAEAKEAHSNLVTSVVAGIAAVSGGDITTATTSAKIEVENNYLNEKEARDLDREFSSCKTSGGNCKEVIEKYIDISNKNSKELAESCASGGVACVTWEELIRASTSVAMDGNGFQVRMSEKLKDSGATALLEYLNSQDLKFLKENISTTDRVLSVVSDPTNWPVIVMSVKSFITGASGKEKLIAAGVTSGASAVIQYGIDKNLSLTDLIGAATIGSITAGKGYNTTVTWNAVGGYYSAEIKGDDPFMAGLQSAAGSSVGYSAGNIIKIPMNRIMNKSSKQYEWVPTGFWTITKPAPQSILPSVSGNIADSAASSMFNFNIENEIKKSNKK